MPKIYPTQVVVVGGSVSPAFSESISLNIKGINDAANSPTDAATFAIALSEAESASAATEAVKLGISGSGVNDSSAAPTETKTFTLRAWLSASATSNALGTSDSVGTPANANGQNDGAVATITTAVAGNARCTMSSTLGANLPSGISIASCVYRGWFKSVNTLITSTTRIFLHSTTGLFGDQTIFTNSGLNTTVDHSTGDFTYDLIANGINTLAKLQSLQVFHATTDAVSGVTPAVLTVDAGSIEVAGAFT